MVDADRRRRASPTQRSQPKVAAASTARRRRQAARQHLVAVGRVLLLEELPGGHAHDARARRLGGEELVRLERQTSTSEPVAIRMSVGRAVVGRVGQHVGAAPTPAAGAYRLRSSVGSFWRVRTQRRGAVVVAQRDLHASTVSLASAGRRSPSGPGWRAAPARCSTGWCVGPSSPRPIDVVREDVDRRAAS